MLQHIVLLTILLTQGITSGSFNYCCGNGETDDFKGSVLRVYFNVRRFTENGPRSYPRRKWVHTVAPYSMTCLIRADTGHFLAIYHGEDVVDTVHVEGCGKSNEIARSVTIVPQQDASHVVQYEFSPYSVLVEGADLCKRVTYFGNDNKEYKVGQCDVSCQLGNCNKNGYKNGWKEEEVKIYGYVNSFTNQMTTGCEFKGGWKLPVKDVILQCFDCKDEFVAQINYKGTTLSASYVGTCMGQLYESFNVVSPKKETPGVIGVQFWLRDGKCVKKYYDTKERVQVNGEDPCSDGVRNSNAWWKLRKGDNKPE